MWLLLPVASAETGGVTCDDTGIVDRLAPATALPVDGAADVAPNVTALVTLAGDTDDLEAWTFALEVDDAPVTVVTATACWWQAAGPLRACVVTLDPAEDLPADSDAVLVATYTDGERWTSTFHTGATLNGPGEGSPTVAVGDVRAVEVPCGGGALQAAPLYIHPARPNTDGMDYVLVRAGSEGLNDPVYGQALTPADGALFSLDVALPAGGDYCVWVEQIDAAGRHSWASPVACAGEADSGAPKVLEDQCDIALQCMCGCASTPGPASWGGLAFGVGILVGRRRHPAGG